MYYFINCKKGDGFISAYTIERRFCIEELKFLIEKLDNVIKKYDVKGSYSLLIDNVPKAKLMLECFVEYNTRLEKYIEECINNIQSDGFRDWYVNDNELAKKIAFTILWKYLCYYGINRN